VLGGPPICTIGAATATGRSRESITRCGHGRWRNRFLLERDTHTGGGEIEVLECIEFSPRRNAARRIEVQLLSDADALDFLGVVGALRDFSRTPKTCGRPIDISRKRRSKLPGMLCLATSKALAGAAPADMRTISLRSFEADSVLAVSEAVAKA